IWKNARTLPGFFCRSRNLELTARCKSLGARINVRATPWFLTSFQTIVRIDLRRVRREKEQSEAVFHLVHEAMHRLGLVCGQSVDDEKDLFRIICDQPAQELDEQRR